MQGFERKKRVCQRCLSRKWAVDRWGICTRCERRLAARRALIKQRHLARLEGRA